MSLRVHHLNCGTLCPACARLINGKDAQGHKKAGWKRRA